MACDPEIGYEPGDGAEAPGRNWLAMDGSFPGSFGCVYGVVLNDRAALDAWGDQLDAAPYKAPPQAPVLYIKPRNTVVASGSVVRRPAGAEVVRIGGALGVVFGAPACRVPADQALDCVRGFAPVADLSLPIESLHRPPIRETCFDGACPIGGEVPKARLADHGAVRIVVSLNGNEMQQVSLESLLRPLGRLIADVSDFMTLYPGDVLMVGAAHDAPLARAGDAFSVEISGVGRVDGSVA